MSYSYARATAGRNTVRLATQTLPDSSVLTYEYLSTSNGLGADLSRVTRIKLGSNVVALYKYTGLQMVEESLPDPNVYTYVHSNTTGDYPYMDRFNRMTSSRWKASTPSPEKVFYDVTLGYDRDSGIATAEDKILVDGSSHGLFDVKYDLDSLNRLTRAKEGYLSGGSISTAKRDEVWTLDQLGNWSLFKRDVNGDLDYTDTDELQDARSFNEANELTGRDTDNNGTDNYTPAYDAAGQETDDGKDYTNKFDGWGRLKEVHNRSGGALVAEYKYNGAGMRTGWHYDANASGTVDSSDVWYYFVYDIKWRPVATYRESSGTLDTYAKEVLGYHDAGLDGSGGSSYIDAVIFKKLDDTNGWTGAADGTLEITHYLCQNWRGDLSLVVKSNGGGSADQVCRIKYSSYGVPTSMPGGDLDCDGDLDSTDLSNIPTGGYTVLKDVNLDGVNNASDATAAGSAITLGRGILGQTAIRLRKGYAGYERDPALAGTKYHVRFRVMDAELGTWLQRDPIGYVGGLNLYEYVGSGAVDFYDPLGLFDWWSLVPGDSWIDFGAGYADSMTFGLTHYLREHWSKSSDYVNDHSIAYFAGEVTELVVSGVLTFGSGSLRAGIRGMTSAQRIAEAGRIRAAARALNASRIAKKVARAAKAGKRGKDLLVDVHHNIALVGGIPGHIGVFPMAAAPRSLQGLANLGIFTRLMFRTVHRGKVGFRFHKREAMIEDFIRYLYFNPFSVGVRGLRDWSTASIVIMDTDVSNTGAPRWDVLGQIAFLPTPDLGSGSSRDIVGQIAFLPTPDLGGTPRWDILGQIAFLPTPALGSGSSRDIVGQIAFLPTPDLGGTPNWDIRGQIEFLPQFDPDDSPAERSPPCCD